MNYNNKQFTTALMECEVDLLRKLLVIGVAGMPPASLHEWALEYLSEEEFEDFYLTFFASK